MKSKFIKWFEAQFGKRPSHKSIHELHSELEAARKKYEAALKIWQDCLIYDGRCEVALKGWSAKEKK